MGSRTLSYALIAIPTLSLVAAIVATLVDINAALSFLGIHALIGVVSAVALLGRLAVLVGSERQLRTPWRRIGLWLGLTLLGWPVVSAIWLYLLGFLMMGHASSAEGGMQARGMFVIVVALAIVIGAWTTPATAVLLAHRRSSSD